MEAEEVNTAILKTTPIIRDFSLNPSCAHGPTILFERDGQRHFSCSAYRSRKLCPFYMPEEEWAKKVSKANSAVAGREDRNPYAGSKADRKAANPLSNPTQRDKGEAQYHFNEKTVEFFMQQFENLGVDSVLCIGTPSLHKQIGDGEGELKSFLLDIDNRFIKLHKENFALYNMCNHHFFQDSEKYRKFLANSKKLALVVDPPFGVKVELMWHGCLSGVKRDFVQMQGESGADSNLEVFWIFPYFMEGHILSKCPEAKLKMSDFHVEYRNHTKYSGGPRSKSSPIRVFTTVPLSTLALPESDYRYCDTCSKWVDTQNFHCDLCETCPTKDGGKTYVHCLKCMKCVKPTWSHCMKCRTCHLNDGNSCKQNQRNSRSGRSSFAEEVSSSRQKNGKDQNVNRLIELKRMNPVSRGIIKDKNKKNERGGRNNSVQRPRSKRNNKRQ